MTIECCRTQDVTRLEHVVIKLSYVVDEGIEPDIKFILCSPMQTCSIIFNSFSPPRKKSKLIQRKWPFMSVQFWGENPLGNWKLEIGNDLSGNDTGKFTLLLR